VEASPTKVLRERNGRQVLPMQLRQARNLPEATRSGVRVLSTNCHQSVNFRDRQAAKLLGLPILKTIRFTPFQIRRKEITPS